MSPPTLAARVDKLEARVDELSRAIIPAGKARPGRKPTTCPPDHMAALDDPAVSLRALAVLLGVSRQTALRMRRRRAAELASAGVEVARG